MFLADLMEQYKYLGREFLVWLWWRSERDGGVINTEAYISPTSVAFDKNIALSDQHSKITWSGNDEMHEAREGLRTGKTINKATLHITQDDMSFRVTVSGANFDLSGIALPKTLEPTGDEQDGKEAYLLDRAYLFRELHTILDRLLKLFLSYRLNPDLWRTELASIRQWVDMGGVSGALDA